MVWKAISKRFIITILIGLGLFSVPLFSSSADAVSLQEGKRIEYLISCVEHLTGAEFVRNGSHYDGKQAAAHLRMKLSKAGDRVQSAEDFITLCASKSYLSGKPYLILFPDGKTVPAGDFFHKKLKEYRPPYRGEAAS
jgi:hypothetical protein